MEQKNGSIVRQIVGYDRCEGELAYRQRAELYRALRLYVNVFQPSLKLVLKRREGSQVYRRYDAAQTPLQRLRAAAVLAEASRARLVALAEALDPVQALRHLHLLQEALWRHAVTPAPAPAPTTPAPPPTVRCILPRAAAAEQEAAEQGAAEQGAAEQGTAEQGTAVGSPARLSLPHPERHTRRGAQTNATRADPCADEVATVDAWLAAQLERPLAEPSADGLRKERRQRCQDCGKPFSVFPHERERTSAYCARCGTERRRAQARARMQALRARRRTGAG